MGRKIAGQIGYVFDQLKRRWVSDGSLRGSKKRGILDIPKGMDAVDYMLDTSHPERGKIDRHHFNEKNPRNITPDGYTLKGGHAEVNKGSFKELHSEDYELVFYAQQPYITIHDPSAFTRDYLYDKGVDDSFMTTEQVNELSRFVGNPTMWDASWHNHVFLSKRVQSSINGFSFNPPEWVMDRIMSGEKISDDEYAALVFSKKDANDTFSPSSPFSLVADEVDDKSHGFMEQGEGTYTKNVDPSGKLTYLKKPGLVINDKDKFVDHFLSMKGIDSVSPEVRSIMKGYLTRPENWKGHRVYNEKPHSKYGDLFVGYEFTKGDDMLADIKECVGMSDM